MAKTHTYGAKGEEELDDVFKKALGIGVNATIRELMKDVKNMGYNDVYDTRILVNHITLRELTQKLQKIQNRREELEEELKSLDLSEKELEEAIKRIDTENKEYQENKKENRNIKLNTLCNKILIAYSKEKASFDSIKIQSIIDDSETEEPINIVIGYLENTLKSLDTKNTICLHETKFDKGYKVKISANDVDKILDMLSDLRY